MGEETHIPGDAQANGSTHESPNPSGRESNDPILRGPNSKHSKEILFEIPDQLEEELAFLERAVSGT